MGTENGVAFKHLIFHRLIEGCSGIGEPALLPAKDVNIFVVIRTVTYAALFIGFVLVYLSGRFLAWSGIVAPATNGAPQVAGMIMVTIGTATALWCVFVFVFIGKGTPAPFDPPRKLVIRGPYRFVRNPMYIGAGMTLAGAALFYESLSIFIYTGVFFLATHLFVVLYEEPTLRRTFGDEIRSVFRPRQPLAADEK
jgi:protein-S-isoprenylcysteine O-methyltransferase Ste14